MERTSKNTVTVLVLWGSLLLSTSVQGQALKLKNLSYGTSGEIHFYDETQYENGNPAVGEFDWFRWDFFADYKIDKHWSLTSKVKTQHLLDSDYDRGDVWVDNLYLKYKHSGKIAVQAGIVSVPLNGGKPKVYGSVLLAPVEKYLTYGWRELGVAVSGSFENSLSYKATITSGLNPIELQSKSGIYGARNYKFASSMDNVAVGAQLKYAPTHSLSLGTSFLYSGLENSSDFDGDLSGANYKVSEVFALYKYNKFQARTMAVYSTVAESDKINDAFHNKVGSAQVGGLLEFSYDFSKALKITDSNKHFKAFVRGEIYDTHFRTDGIEDDSKYDHNDYTVGLVFKPLAFLQLKADYQFKRVDGHANNQMLNLSVGYNF